MRRKENWKELVGGHRYVFGVDNDLPLTLAQIARAISHINRFTGHTRTQIPYTVAQHSVFVSNLLDLDARWAMAGLLHDAPEIIIGDISSPLKWEFGARWMRPVRAEERRALKTIARALELPKFARFDETTEVAVKHADRVAIMTEKRDIMSRGHGVRWIGEPYDSWPKAHPSRIVPVTHDVAVRMFVKRFRELKARLG